MSNEYDMEKLLEQLKRQEGCRRNACGKIVCYRCPAGKLTIGYGHNLDAWPLPGIGPNSALTEEEASDLLRSDVQHVAGQVKDRLPWIDKLTPARQAALINMAFNLGIGGLLGFKNTLAAIEQGDYVRAARGMLASKWATQVHGRADELAAQMRTGEWA